MNYQFNWQVLFDNLPYILGGLKYTLLVTVVTMGIGLIVGLLIAVMRMSPRRLLRWPAFLLIELIRGVPLLLALWWVYLVLPVISGFKLSPLAAVFIAFTIYVAVHSGETYRSGFQSLPRGQTEAGLALGMTYSQVWFRYILPQGFKRTIPALGNLWVAIFKDTALVFVVSLQDIMFRGTIIAEQYYRPFEVYTLIFIVFFLLAWPQARLVDKFYERHRIVQVQ